MTENIKEIDIVNFLKNLTINIECKNIKPEDMLKISEFYLQYNYGETFVDIEEKEILKYYCMGWYVYNHLK